MRFRTALGIALLTTFAGACSSALQSPAASTDSAPINEIRTKFQAAYNAGDAAAVAALYADDGVTQPDHAPAVSGKANIEKAMQEAFSQAAMNIAITPTDTEVNGDVAHEHGTFTTTVTPKAGGAPMTSEGKYLVIIERQADGTWKIVHDIDNSSTPPPAAAATPAPAQ
jgi:uncharacterized protein (TIGR02246 family)